jgi:hypothetical protein
MARRQRDELDASANEEPVRGNKERIGPVAHKRCEGSVDLEAGVGIDDLHLQSHGARSRFHVSQHGLGICRVGGIDEHGNASGCGHQLTQKLQPLRRQLNAEKLIPVALPPGRPRLATTPSLTGSSGMVKTVGIVVVAALAASTGTEPSVATITETCLRTNSAASAGSQSNRFSAQR